MRRIKRMGHISIGTIVYIIIGVIVANNFGYFADLSTIMNIAAAALSVALWPLLFLNISFHGLSF